MIESAITFFETELKIKPEEINRSKIVSIRRTRTAYSSKIKNEVLILFDCTSTRDYFFSHAKNLSSSLRRESVGLRLDYPAYLGSDYRALDAYGAHLRKQAGTGFRRNIRFDDDTLGLHMDVNFPSNPGKWIRVTPKLAKEHRDVATVEGEDDARKLINESLFPRVASGANSVPINTDWRVPRTNNLGEPMT